VDLNTKNINSDIYIISKLLNSPASIEKPNIKQIVVHLNVTLPGSRSHEVIYYSYKPRCVEFGEENFSVKSPKDKNLLAKCVGSLCRGFPQNLKNYVQRTKSTTFRKIKPVKRFPSVPRTVNPPQSKDTWSFIHKRTHTLMSQPTNHQPYHRTMSSI